ncbi:proteasome subunit alpha type-4-like [Drosophila serrata]|uniref:proteasome subunit alpha type-4-like n=1 Tax=Drosophila serrata TaxID=7274 RepID=UPI000A1D38CD|nr:proteasome subunit alpha type-4-like [Drosophila serrata]
MFPNNPSPPLFSPEGRLYEVEHAMEEVAKAAPSVAILAEDGIAVAAIQEDLFPLMAKQSALGHIFRVDHDNACAVTGIMTDGFKLVSVMSTYSQRHRRAYGELMPTERLVENICRKKQSYTMYTGKRPFGIAVIYMGWDSERGWQIYHSDPSGNYGRWKSSCIGRHAHRAQEYLDQMLVGKPLPSLSLANELAIKAIKVAMEGIQLTGSAIQMATMQRNRTVTKFHTVADSVVQDLYNLHCAGP